MSVTHRSDDASAIATGPGSDDDRVAGALIAGRYRLIEPLGEGAMGTVFLAEHEGLRRRVALKFLQDEYAGNRDVAARFAREAVAAARLQHPNVISVYDSGTDERGRCFLAMEYVGGEALRAVLERDGALPRARVIAIAGQVAAGLDHAHSLGIVHRDVKPENVLVLSVDGVETVKVIDFGIAKVFLPEGPGGPGLTRSGMALGTPEYMAPEQAAGGEVDRRADVYALAVMTYEMLVGARPFEGDDVMALLMAHLNAAPPPPSARRPDLGLGPSVDEAFAAGLAKRPSARPESAAAFVAMVQRALDAPPVERARTEPPPRSDAPPAAPAAPVMLASGPGSAGLVRRRATLAGLAGVATIAVALLALRSRGSRDAAAQPGASTALHRGARSAVEARAAADDVGARVDALLARDDLRTTTSRERQAAARALEAMRARSPDDPALAAALGSVYARDRATQAMAHAAYRDALRATPSLAARAPVVDDVMRVFATNGALAGPAGALLRGPLAGVAVDALVETATRSGSGRARAAALLAEEPFSARLDATQRGLIALSGARSCEAKRAAAEALGRDGDARALPALRRIPIGSGCGFLGLGTCNACLGAALPAAIRAIEARAPDAG
jgi:eukaryotic-like serine/threonine-protein kinase